MNRYCFVLRVATRHLEEYRRRHAEVWDDMKDALSSAGWQNYSLFLSADGLLVGYVESDASFDQLQARMAATEVNTRWQAEMAPFFVGIEDTPDAAMVLLPEVFHLD